MDERNIKGFNPTISRFDIQIPHINYVLATKYALATKVSGLIKPEEIGTYNEAGNSYALIVYAPSNLDEALASEKPCSIIITGIHNTPIAIDALAMVFEGLYTKPETSEVFNPLIVIPAVNGYGLDNNSRYDSEGRDMNTFFWIDSDNKPKQVSLLESFLSKLHEKARKHNPNKIFAYFHLDENQENQDIVYSYPDGHPNAPELAMSTLRTAELWGGKIATQEIVDGIKIERGIIKGEISGAFGPPPSERANAVDISLKISDILPYSRSIMTLFYKFNPLILGKE